MSKIRSKHWDVVTIEELMDSCGEKMDVYIEPKLGRPPKKCKRCKNTGEISVRVGTAFGMPLYSTTPVICPKCKGSSKKEMDEYLARKRSIENVRSFREMTMRSTCCGR